MSHIERLIDKVMDKDLNCESFSLGKYKIVSPVGVTILNYLIYKDDRLVLTVMVELQLNKITFYGVLKKGADLMNIFHGFLKHFPYYSYDIVNQVIFI